MRVLIAPDKFAGTLTALQAAEAIAEGWARRAPDDELDLAPMADGGPGFADVLHRARGGDRSPVVVRGPLGEPTPASVLTVGETAYLECAQACGIHLTGGRRGEEATSYGVGELLAAAVDSGARRIVLGLGGSGCNDGGAGVLAALGVRAPDGLSLESGAVGLEPLRERAASIDPTPARDRLAGVELVAATDVDSTLTGLFGATKNFGPQKGISEERLLAVDAVLEAWAEATDRRVSLQQGAGAAGGIGFALMLLGATREPGVDLVAEAIDLEARARAADLVVTGEGAFDFSSRSGKVPYGVAAIAQRTLRPCIALAGQVFVGAREMRALGMDSAYAMAETVGEELSFSDPAGSLATLAERVARTWSR